MPIEVRSRVNPDHLFPVSPELKNAFKAVLPFYPDLAFAKLQDFTHEEWDQIAKALVTHGLVSLYHYSYHPEVITAVKEALAIIHNERIQIKMYSKDIPSRSAEIISLIKELGVDPDQYVNTDCPMFMRSQNGSVSLLIPTQWMTLSVIYSPIDALFSLVLAASHLRDSINDRMITEMEAANARAFALATEVVLQAAGEFGLADPKVLLTSPELVRANSLDKLPSGLSSPAFNRKYLYQNPKLENFNPVEALKPPTTSVDPYDAFLDDLDSAKKIKKAPKVSLRSRLTLNQGKNTMSLCSRASHHTPLWSNTLTPQRI